MLSLLNAKGFIWRGDEKGGWTSGIPSLLDYMIEQTEFQRPHRTSSCPGRLTFE